MFTTDRWLNTVIIVMGSLTIICIGFSIPAIYEGLTLRTWLDICLDDPNEECDLSWERLEHLNKDGYGNYKPYQVLPKAVQQKYFEFLEAVQSPECRLQLCPPLGNLGSRHHGSTVIYAKESHVINYLHGYPCMKSTPSTICNTCNIVPVEQILQDVPQREYGFVMNEPVEMQVFFRNPIILFGVTILLSPPPPTGLKENTRPKTVEVIGQIFLFSEPLHLGKFTIDPTGSENETLIIEFPKPAYFAFLTVTFTHEENQAFTIYKISFHGVQKLQVGYCSQEGGCSSDKQEESGETNVKIKFIFKIHN